MEPQEVSLRDIIALRDNNAWRYLIFEWEAILEELQFTLVGEDYPGIYRTQGRVSVLAEILTTLDKLEELIKETKDGN